LKVIITGATGFLGRNIAESFHSADIKVCALGRNQDVGKQLTASGMTFKAADVLDLDSLESNISPADCIVHCAGLSGPWGRCMDFYNANVIGTRNVVSACKQHGIDKMVFISSPSIYYNGKDRFDISESDPLPKRQSSNYARSKLIVETELMNLAKQGFKTIALRPRAVFGPYDKTFVPRILRLSEKKQFPLIGGGTALVDMTYIEDFVVAAKKCLTAPGDAWNQAYNISSGQPIPLKDWFGKILEIFHRPFKPKTIPERPAKIMASVMETVSYFPFVNKEPAMTRFSVGYMAKSMTMRIDKAKRLLGYSPLFSIDECFERYRSYVDQNQLASGTSK